MHKKLALMTFSVATLNMNGMVGIEPALSQNSNNMNNIDIPKINLPDNNWSCYKDPEFKVYVGNVNSNMIIGGRIIDPIRTPDDAIRVCSLAYPNSCQFNSCTVKPS